MEEYNGVKIKKTRYEKSGSGYLVMIDEHNFAQLIEISKLVEKGKARSLQTYCDGMFHYYSEEKLSI